MFIGIDRKQEELNLMSQEGALREAQEAEWQSVPHDTKSNS